MAERYQNMLTGTINIDHYTSSTKVIIDKVIELYRRIMNKELLVRRINVTANNVVNEEKAEKSKSFDQLDLFGNYQVKEKQLESEKTEKKLQKAMINIKNRYGKNAIIKGMNLQEAGTTIERNAQVGGHRA